MAKWAEFPDTGLLLGSCYNGTQRTSKMRVPHGPGINQETFLAVLNSQGFPQLCGNSPLSGVFYFYFQMLINLI